MLIEPLTECIICMLTELGHSVHDICQVYYPLELQQPGELQSLKGQFTQICKFWPFFLKIICIFLTGLLLFVCGKSKEKISRRITLTMKLQYIQSLLDHTTALCMEQTKI